MWVHLYAIADPQGIFSSFNMIIKYIWYDNKEAQIQTGRNSTKDQHNKRRDNLGWTRNKATHDPVAKDDGRTTPRKDYLRKE